MEYRQMLYACTLAETCSFSKAAQTLFITQPTLSTQIQKLETELGFALFLRSTRQVSLTPRGEAMIARFHAVLDAWEDVRAEAERLSGQAGHALTMGIFPTRGRSYLLGWNQAFTQQAHGFTLSLKVMRPELMVQRILSGRLDLALLHLQEHQQLPEALAFTPVGYVQHVLVLPNAHPLARRAVITADDLRGQTFILADTKAWPLLQQDLSGSLRDCETLIEPELFTMLDMVQAGMGIGFASQSLMRIHGASRALTWIPPDHAHGAQIGCIYRRDHPRAALFEPIVAAVQAVLRENGEV